ncbi:UDP-N-acetylglucosamine--dolichyl-phosphate N-acetylglucosaminephosphotransferase [Nematocida major]|uniref:UDP-N-acetylglucosamine--dolichyl-phosphate N-acetylglucosaminephosphotransferase n=1 Tax=Nematocida major TaxID=1912982 RepID=UPI0020074AE3|nr:UDP-N-acetylglucosamine--dolichyl-phosphate N-acetylglucosaminephosphotransferase [Nematocida major]KAH9387337.1 UDP-N-acetylglucosamine--dolichyl-phosphate N-acetylglucosaminephosphotransferase [Nematocida major]
MMFGRSSRAEGETPPPTSPSLLARTVKEIRENFPTWKKGKSLSFPRAETVRVCGESPQILDENFSLFIFLVPFAAGVLSYKLCQRLMARSKNFGVDYHKKDAKHLPESIGLSSGVSFVLCIFLLSGSFQAHKESLLIFSNTIILNILLGYVDDILDLTWSCKMVFPVVATLPLLFSYSGSTCICIPFYGVLNLGWAFYVCLVALSVYFTNAINILSGINGVECGQTLVISGMMVVDRLLFFSDKGLLSILLCASLFFSTFSLFLWNKYPAKCFVGDTFCYFAGSALLCIGLFGGFVKTLFLFFSLQLLNFLMSLPQIAKIIPCPRHRMPASDFTGAALLKPSIVEVSKKHVQSSYMCRLVISLFTKCRLISCTENKESICLSNFTVLNAILVWTGPISEPALFNVYMALQCAVCLCVILAKFAITALSVC